MLLVINEFLDVDGEGGEDGDGDGTGVSNGLLNSSNSAWILN